MVHFIFYNCHRAERKPDRRRWHGVLLEPLATGCKHCCYQPISVTCLSATQHTAEWKNSTLCNYVEPCSMSLFNAIFVHVPPLFTV